MQAGISKFKSLNFLCSVFIEHRADVKNVTWVGVNKRLMQLNRGREACGSNPAVSKAVHFLVELFDMFFFFCISGA